MNGSNRWNVGYSSIRFFENVLSNHTAVALFQRDNDIQFRLSRTRGFTDLNVVFVDQYQLGEAAAYAIIEEFSGVNVIVNNGHWTHIVLNWRDFAVRTGVVILKLTDFMGALNVEDLRQYIIEDERAETDARRRESS